jgi:hypothetical protein
MGNSNSPYELKLRVGDWAEVRSVDEILATLDENGTLDFLPFMPEMLKYCGRQFRVYKRVDKTCDTIIRDGTRTMKNTVLLEGLRCDGEAHGGCQAECMLFWKEAWLKKIETKKGAEPNLNSATSAGPCNLKTLTSKTRVAPESTPAEDMVYSCQATEMRKATTPLPARHLGQYFRDVWSGNVKVLTIIKGFLIWIFNVIQAYRKGGHYPYISGNLDKTPVVKLDLQPGELVQVRPKTEILDTLDVMHRNRGLSFDREMVRYCGGTYRVHRRVNKLLNEKTGKMIDIKADCIVLEGVICTGELNRFCPRSVFPIWKEIWLKRVE